LLIALTIFQPRTLRATAQLNRSSSSLEAKAVRQAGLAFYSLSKVFVVAPFMPIAREDGCATIYAALRQFTATTHRSKPLKHSGLHANGRG
jgi:hypothetical protein